MDACRIPIRDFPDPKVDTPLTTEPVEKTAVLAGGCFWCVEAVFKELRECLTSPRGSIPYNTLGERLGMAEGAVKVAVHRLRHRYRELLREEIARTVSTPEEVEEELRYLFIVLSR